MIEMFLVSISVFQCPTQQSRETVGEPGSRRHKDDAEIRVTATARRHEAPRRPQTRCQHVFFCPRRFINGTLALDK